MVLKTEAITEYHFLSKQLKVGGVSIRIKVFCEIVADFGYEGLGDEKKRDFFLISRRVGGWVAWGGGGGGGGGGGSWRLG